MFLETYQDSQKPYMACTCLILSKKVEKARFRIMTVKVDNSDRIAWALLPGWISTESEKRLGNAGPSFLRYQLCVGRWFLYGY